ARTPRTRGSPSTPSGQAWPRTPHVPAGSGRSAKDLASDVSAAASTSSTQCGTFIHCLPFAATRTAPGHNWGNDMATAQPTSTLGGTVRKAFGLLLFVAWGLMTIVWVYDAIYDITTMGNPVPAIAGVCAILLMLLLAGMEGLEVAVIDRWRDMFPDRPRSELGEWLSARQLFVALI